MPKKSELEKKIEYSLRDAELAIEDKEKEIETLEKEVEELQNRILILRDLLKESSPKPAKEPEEPDMNHFI